MQHPEISATELARNIAQTIDQVRMSGQSVYVTKGKQRVAELGPPPKQGISIEKLAQIMAKIPHLGNTDAQAMTQDLDLLRQEAILPENPWDS